MTTSKKSSGKKAYAFTATATRLAAGTRYAYRIVTSGGSTALDDLHHRACRARPQLDVLGLR